MSVVDPDPFQLDSTHFAEVMKEVALAGCGCSNAPEEPPHPLRENTHIASLADYLSQSERVLYGARYPEGGGGEDSYFLFNEGLMLRPEIVVRLCIDYLRDNPEALRE